MDMRLTTLLIFGIFIAVPVLSQDRARNSDIDNIGSRDINKGSINFDSLDKEIAMGRQLSTEYERKVKLYDNADVNEYVSRLGQNLSLNSDAKALPMTFKVAQSADVDAQAFPGGFVYINTGTIAAVDNEAELAFVLAQQVAHIAAHHGTEQASKVQLLNTSTSPGVDVQPQTAARLVSMQMAQFARRDMMEADFLGMQYLYNAGYDPNAATTFLQKIAAVERGTSGTARMFNPVPPAAERIAAMRKNIPLILPARSQNVVTTPEFDRIKAIVEK
jgi:predicted Zn-dependent protease